MESDERKCGPVQEAQVGGCRARSLHLLSLVSAAGRETDFLPVLQRSCCCCCFVGSETLLFLAVCVSYTHMHVHDVRGQSQGCLPSLCFDTKSLLGLELAKQAGLASPRYLQFLPPQHRVTASHHHSGLCVCLSATISSHACRHPGACMRAGRVVCIQATWPSLQTHIPGTIFCQEYPLRKAFLEQGWKVLFFS